MERSDNICLYERLSYVLADGIWEGYSLPIQESPLVNYNIYYASVEVQFTPGRI